MFHVVGGCFSTNLIFTIDLMLLKPYFHGTTNRTGAPSCFGSASPYMPTQENCQWMHGLIHAQTFHIGKLNAGRTLREHHTAVEQRLEGYKLGLLRGLDFLDEHIQWETDPWYD